MGSGDGCTIMGMYIVPWNYTLKNGSNGKLSHSSGERMSKIKVPADLVSGEVL